MADESKVVIFGKSDQQQTQGSDKHLDPVVTGTAKIRKRSKKQRFKDEFVVEDAKKVKSYLWTAVIVPSIKDTVWNLITKGLKMFLYRSGEGPANQPGVPTATPYIAYNSIYKSPAAQTYPVARTPYNYGEVIIPNRAEADKVLREMYERIRTGGVATIGDLYQLCGLPTDYPDFTYGWRDLTGAHVVGTDGGYLISLPRPFPI